MTPEVASFHVSVTETPAGTVLTPHGDMDMATVGEFERVAGHLVGSGQASLMIDLSDVAFMDSSGINGLIRVKKACDAAGGQLSLSRPQPRVRDVLRLTGLTEFLALPPQ